VLPVNYKLHDGAIMFRTAQTAPTGEDLRTGIAHAEYQVAFEIEQIDPATRTAGASSSHGPAHHMTSEDERAIVLESGVDPWGPPEPTSNAIRIVPNAVTGRRLSTGPGSLVLTQPRPDALRGHHQCS